MWYELLNVFLIPRAARWPRSGHTLSIKIFCKNYGSVWRVPSTITALSSDYNSYCHSNSSYATSLRPIRAYIYSITTICIRKENIASVTCLMTYSHELQLYRYLLPHGTENNFIHVGLVVVLGHTEQQSASTNGAKTDHRQTFTK